MEHRRLALLKSKAGRRFPNRQATPELPRGSVAQATTPYKGCGQYHPSVHRSTSPKAVALPSPGHSLVFSDTAIGHTSTFWSCKQSLRRSDMVATAGCISANDMPVAAAGGQRDPGQKFILYTDCGTGPDPATRSLFTFCRSCRSSCCSQSGWSISNHLNVPAHKQLCRVGPACRQCSHQCDAQVPPAASCWLSFSAPTPR